MVIFLTQQENVHSNDVSIYTNKHHIPNINNDNFKIMKNTVYSQNGITLEIKQKKYRKISKYVGTR